MDTLGETEDEIIEPMVLASGTESEMKELFKKQQLQMGRQPRATTSYTTPHMILTSPTKSSTKTDDNFISKMKAGNFPTWKKSSRPSVSKRFKRKKQKVFTSRLLTHKQNKSPEEGYDEGTLPLIMTTTSIDHAGVPSSDIDEGSCSFPQSSEISPSSQILAILDVVLKGVTHANAKLSNIEKTMSNMNGRWKAVEETQNIMMTNLLQIQNDQLNRKGCSVYINIKEDEAENGESVQGSYTRITSLNDSQGSCNKFPSRKIVNSPKQQNNSNTIRKNIRKSRKVHNVSNNDVNISPRHCSQNLSTNQFKGMDESINKSSKNVWCDTSNLSESTGMIVDNNPLSLSKEYSSDSYIVSNVGTSRRINTDSEFVNNVGVGNDINTNSEIVSEIETGQGINKNTEFVSKFTPENSANILSCNSSVSRQENNEHDNCNSSTLGENLYFSVAFNAGDGQANGNLTGEQSGKSLPGKKSHDIFKNNSGNSIPNLGNNVQRSKSVDYTINTKAGSPGELDHIISKLRLEQIFNDSKSPGNFAVRILRELSPGLFKSDLRYQYNWNGGGKGCKRSLHSITKQQIEQFVLIKYPQCASPEAFKSIINAVNECLRRPPEKPCRKRKRLEIESGVRKFVKEADCNNSA